MLLLHCYSSTVHIETLFFCLRISNRSIIIGTRIPNCNEKVTCLNFRTQTKRSNFGRRMKRCSTGKVFILSVPISQQLPRLISL